MSLDPAIRARLIEEKIWLKRLRDYQLAMRREVIATWKEGHQRVLLQSGTGTGKSIIIGSFILELWLKDKKVLLVCEQGTLVDQLMHHFLEDGVPREELGIIKAWRSGEYPLELEKPIQLATIQTLDSTWEELAKSSFNPDIIIVDEGHHCDGSNRYYQLWLKAAEARMLSTTATPARPNGRGLYHPYINNGVVKKREPLFNALIIGPKKQELINAGWLPECETYFGLTPDLKKIAKKRDGEFAVDGKDGLEAAYNDGDQGQMLRGDIVANWKKFVLDRYGYAPTLCFGVSVKHARDIAAEFRSNSIPAIALYGELTRAEQRARLRAFITGEAAILCLCAMGTEGFDLATLAKQLGVQEAVSVFCVIKAFATNSLVKDSQVNGRVRGIDLLRWNWKGAPEIGEGGNKPRAGDMVLGGKQPVTGSLVLGGVAGLKHRLSAPDVSSRIRAVKEVFKLGHWDLLSECKEDPSDQIRAFAEAALENPEQAKSGKILRGIIIDSGNNFERFGPYFQDHEWTLDGVKVKAIKTKKCPKCQQGAIAIFVDKCPSCGHVFEKEKPKEKKPRAELLGVDPEPISHDRTAEMVLLDKDRWRKFLSIKNGVQGLDYLIKEGASIGELAIAVRQCKKKDGTPYKLEFAFWRWCHYQKEQQPGWSLTKQIVWDWAKAFGMQGTDADAWVNKIARQEFYLWRAI